MSESVEVKVGAETSALTAGLANAKKAVDGFREHAEESVKELGGEMLEALGFAAVIEGVRGSWKSFPK